MHPGQIHFVVTTKTSFTLGGHFFSDYHYSRMLEAAVIEHFAADLLTNTEHTEVHIIPMKILRRLTDSITRVAAKRGMLQPIAIL